MKLPKIFLPEKRLEKKIHQLLKNEIKRRKGHPIIDKEAEKLFPNFVNYLKDEYGPVIVEKINQVNQKVWVIYLKNEHNKFYIGHIESYVKEKGPTTEYGYKADIVIQEIYKKLLYRTSYQGYDSLGSIVFEEDPRRYDSENIPFP